jgi:hypothetical protein
VRVATAYGNNKEAVCVQLGVIDHELRVHEGLASPVFYCFKRRGARGNHIVASLPVRHDEVVDVHITHWGVSYEVR